MLPPGGAALVLGLDDGAVAAPSGRPSGGRAGVGGWLRAVGEGRRRLVAVGRMGDVRRLLVARAMVESSVMLLHATFADYTAAKWGWDQRAVGLGMALSG
eukprot:2227949-Prymnesium_polylepis.1